MDNNGKKIIVIAVVAACLLVFGLLLLNGGEEPVKSPVKTAEPADLPVEQSPAVQETATEPEDDQGLSDDWQQLTLEQKLSLNPFNCPADENGIIHLSAETGRCLEVPPQKHRDGTVGEDENENRLALGQFFVYGDGLEVAVKSLDCSPADKIELPAGGSHLTLGVFWQRYKNLYVAYRTHPPTSLADSHFALGYARHIGFLDSFEKHLKTSGLSLVPGELGEHLADYKRCLITVIGRNIGNDRYLPDGCGLQFSRAITLVGRQAEYSAQPLETRCTKMIIDFPNGATDRDVSFAFAEVDDEITAVSVRGVDGVEHSVNVGDEP